MQTFFRWLYLAHQFCLTWISQDSQVKFMSKEHLHFMWENFMWKVKLHIKCIWYDFMVSYLHKCFHVKFMWENFKWNSCECSFHKKFIWRTSSWHCFLALHADVLSLFVCVFVDDQPVSVPPTLLFPVPGQYSGGWVRNGGRLSTRAATHVRGTYHTLYMIHVYPGFFFACCKVC